MQMLSHYLVMGWHALRRRPLVSAINLFGVIITLTVLTVAVSILDAELNPRGPERDAGRMLHIVRLALESDDGNRNAGEPGYPFLVKQLEGVPGKHAIFGNRRAITVYDYGLPVDLSVRDVEPSYWEVLSFSPQQGRTFGQGDSGRLVAVLSESTAQELFGRADVVGERLRLDGREFDVIGVVEDVSALESAADADLWLPLWTRVDQTYLDRQGSGFQAIILTDNDQELNEARDTFARNVENFEPVSGFDRAMSQVETKLQIVGRDYLQKWGDDEPPSESLFWGAGLAALILFMALPALNLINLNLSRMWERRAEVGLRKAMGARPANLIGQLLIENLILAIIGWVIALGLSLLVFRAVTASDWLGDSQFILNYRVVVTALVFAIVFGVLSGLIPAWRTARMNPANALKGAR